MWIRNKNLIRLAHTLFDVGLVRIINRLIYEIKKFMGRTIPFFILKYFLGITNNKPQLNLLIKERFIYKKNKDEIKKIKFDGIKLLIINKEIKIDNSFIWNNTSHDRLTIFNLHYFDWSRKWLDYLIDNDEWEEYENSLVYLIDNWIVNNNLRKGDGWHSYTISLRIRNWMWLFQFCPYLVSQKRIKSTWFQFCWLNFNQEYCHGGNHYLENLISLIMVGIQFKGEFAKNIVKRSIYNLNKELNKQVLTDGGHEERSAAYHILILDRLVELACFMEITYKSYPAWLLVHIKRMTKWCECIKLMKNKTPLFNDSAQDDYYNINQIINFSNALIERKYIKLRGLRGRLLSIIFEDKYNFNNVHKENKYQDSLIDLPDTGWTILRPGNGWELIFKCGESCPRHLGAHAHSDLLSFDLFHNGNEVICETGTSLYKSGAKRNFERSISAHNTLQLGKKKNGQFLAVEPIDVWSSFRVGKKAICYDRKNEIVNGWYIVQGSHDGFKNIGGNHHRWLGIKVIKNIPILVIADVITSNKKMALESFLHFSPDSDLFQDFGSFIISPCLNTNKLNLKKEIYNGYYSRGFSLEETRKSVKFSLDITERLFGIFMIFTHPSITFRRKIYPSYYDLKGELDFGNSGKIIWDLESKSFYCS